MIVTPVPATGTFTIEFEETVIQGAAEELVVESVDGNRLTLSITTGGFSETRKRRGEKITDVSQVRVGDTVDLYHTENPGLYKGGGEFIGAKVTETMYGGFAVNSGNPSHFVAPFHVDGGAVEVYLVEKAPRRPDPSTAKVIRIIESAGYPSMAKPVFAISNGDYGYFDSDGDHHDAEDITEWVEYDLNERGIEAEPEVKLEDLGKGDVIRVFETNYYGPDDHGVSDYGVVYRHSGDQDSLPWISPDRRDNFPLWAGNHHIIKWELISRAKENA